MSFRKIIACLIISSSSMLTPSLFAQDAWVKDVSAFYLRSQPSDNFKRIETLYSGDQLNILAKDASGKYYQVKSANGNTGWIGVKNVLLTPVAKVQLEALQKKHEQVSAELNKLKTQSQTTDSQIKDARQERDQAIAERDEALATAGDAPNIKANNMALNAEKVRLKQQVDELNSELAQLKSSGDNSQMIVGGVLVFVGFIFALAAMAFKGKRRSTGWNN